MSESQPTPPGVRASQKIATQKNVLNAALVVFAEKGFEAASIRDIASRAGVNHGLIKYHFQGKEALWKAAVNHLFARLDKNMAQLDLNSGEPPEVLLRNWIRLFVRYCADHPEHARIMNHESTQGSDRLKWAAQEHILPRHKLLLPSIKKLAAQKQLKAPAFSIIYMLNAAMQAPFTLQPELRWIHDQDVTDPDFIQNYADSIYTLFFGSETLDHLEPKSQTESQKQRPRKRQRKKS